MLGKTYQKGRVETIRMIRDSATPLSGAQSHQILLEVLEHLYHARRHLECSRQDATPYPGLIAPLEEQLRRLERTIANTERLLHAGEPSADAS